MTRILWSLLAATVLLALSVGSATAADEQAVASVPQKLFVISKLSEEERKQQAYQGNSSYGPKVLGLSLADNSSLSEQPSREYSFDEGPLLGICLYPFTCGAASSAHGELKNVGENFELAPLTSVHAEVHLAWAAQQRLPDVAPNSQNYGSVSFGLQIAGRQLRGDTFVFHDASGDAVIPVDFGLVDQKCPTGSGNQTPCDPKAPTSGGSANDIVMSIAMQTYYSLDQPAGQTLDVKLDTSGGSYLVVPKVLPPPAPVSPKAAAPDVATANATGNESAQPVAFDAHDAQNYLPAPIMPLVIAALGVGVALRRRLG